MSTAASPSPVRRVVRGVKRRAVRFRERRRLSRDQRCVICGEAVWVVDLTATAGPRRTCHMEICTVCGHVSNLSQHPRLRHSTKPSGDIPIKPRVGTPTARVASSTWPRWPSTSSGALTSTSSSTARVAAWTTTTSRPCERAQRGHRGPPGQTSRANSSFDSRRPRVVSTTRSSGVTSSSSAASAQPKTSASGGSREADKRDAGVEAQAQDDLLGGGGRGIDAAPSHRAAACGRDPSDGVSAAT